MIIVSVINENIDNLTTGMIIYVIYHIDYRLTYNVCLMEIIHKITVLWWIFMEMIVIM